jgi:hypothetical protein
MERDPVDTANSAADRSPRIGDCKSSKEMIGEGLRECGILIAVFVPIDSLFQHGLWGGWAVRLFGIVLGIVIFWGGIRLERSRSDGK